MAFSSFLSGSSSARSGRLTAMPTQVNTLHPMVLLRQLRGLCGADEFIALLALLPGHSTTTERDYIFVEPLTEQFQPAVSLQFGNAQRSKRERKKCRVLGNRFEHTGMRTTG